MELVRHNGTGNVTGINRMADPHDGHTNRLIDIKTDVTQTSFLLKK